MNFTWVDLRGLLVATPVCGLVVVLPGVILARMAGILRDETGRRTWLGAIVAGLALLPLVDSLVTRVLGLDAALGLTMVLAVAAIADLAAERFGDPGPRGRWSGVAVTKGSLFAVLLAAAWVALVAIEWVDFDVAGKLFQPLTVFDTVKHAATTRAILDSGAPPRDAFFLRPERASYYYFFYTPPALVLKLCGGLVDARAAVGAMIVWTGFGVYGLIRLLVARLGVALDPRRRPVLIVAVLAAGGLDIVAVLAFALSRGYWIADPLQWNEQAAAWIENILWVPHHVTALIAGALGLVTLCRAVGDPGSPPPPARAAAGASIVGGLCFASMLGLSVWVTLAFVLTVVGWLVILCVERRWRGAAFIVLAGLVALGIAVPHLVDLRAGRSGGDGLFPISATVRAFALSELFVPEGPWRVLSQLVLMPLNYAIEFGVLVLGSFLYWRQKRIDGRPGGELSRVLVVAALAGLLAGGFLRSTIFNNDLGWRVTLLPLLAGTVWTVAALEGLLSRPVDTRARRWAPAFLVLFVLGWTTVLYMAVSMRAYPFMTINPGARFLAADPASERALRVAYGWAGRHLPEGSVVQQNPAKRRALAFGLYGCDPIAVADTFGGLFGADPNAVTARLASIGPIFTTELTMSEIAARARAAGIDDLVVTAADPVWAMPDGFVWRVKPVFAADRVRIVPVATIEAAR